MGKSGEGKSVTIKHIMGILKPDAGDILVDDRSILGLSHQELISYRSQFGMLFQHAALFDSMTVLENVTFPMIESGGVMHSEAIERASVALKQVGVSDAIDKFPSALSTGEKKRVGLARALVTRPRFLLYDEPTTGMDPLVCDMIDELIVRVKQQNPQLTSIVISHDLKAALATADEIIMLYKGQVALQGPPQLFRETQHPVIRQFFSGKVEGPMEFM